MASTCAQVCVLPVTVCYKGYRCIIRPRIEEYFTGEEMTAAQLEDLMKFLRDKLEIEGY